MRASRTPHTGAVLAALAVGLLVTACGAGGSSSASDGSATSGNVPTSADLSGSTFESTSVEGHDLVAGTSVRLTFEDQSLSANAGCNTMTSTYAVTDGNLAWTGHPMATMMGCPDDLLKQDTWLTDLLQQGADATLAGDALTLTAGDVTLHLQRQGSATPAALLGTTWTVNGLIDGTSVSSLPAGTEAPTLDIAADGSVQLFTGCNHGHTKVTVDGDTAQFDPAATTRMACPPAATKVEQAVLQVLDGQVSVTVDGSTATLTKGQHGLVMQAG